MARGNIKNLSDIRAFHRYHHIFLIFHRSTIAIVCLSKIYLHRGFISTFRHRGERVKEKCLEFQTRERIWDTETVIDQVNSLVPLQREFFLFTHDKTIDVHTYVRVASKTFRFFLAFLPRSTIRNLNRGDHLFCETFQDGSTRLARKTPFYLLTNRFNTATIAALVSSSLFLSREQRRRIYAGSYAKPSPPSLLVQKPFPVPKHRNGRFHRPRYIGYERSSLVQSRFNSASNLLGTIESARILISREFV